MQITTLISQKNFTHIIGILVIPLFIIGCSGPTDALTTEEQKLLAEYEKNTDLVTFTTQMRNNLKDLSGNLGIYRRIGATMDMGLQWFNLREFEHAIRWWKIGLELEPDNVIGWYNLGNAYMELRQFSRAEDAYRESIVRARGGEIEACLALGEMYRYLWTEKADEEPKLYEECLEKHENNRDLIARMATYYKSIEDYDKAIFWFDRLFSIEPSTDVAMEIRELRLKKQGLK